MGGFVLTGALVVDRAGPAMTIQDLGRPGYMAKGLSVGGAADRTAMIEGAAILGQRFDLAAIEMAAFGGAFSATSDCRFALTGAPMRASLDGEPLAWNASYRMKAGQKLSIGAATSGVYGYLHVGGGIALEPVLGSRATHLNAGLGKLIDTGGRLPIGLDSNAGDIGKTLVPFGRYSGGTVRLLPSVQTHRFSQAARSRFEATAFKRSPRGNRQGIELSFEGEPFSSDDQLTVLSEPMVAGDVQMTGAGVPFVLLPECQTTGGYPRIGTVVPSDLPTVVQAAIGSTLKFQFVTFEEVQSMHISLDQMYRDLQSKLRPLVRDPWAIRDLLSYQLVGGVVNATEAID